MQKSLQDAVLRLPASLLISGLTLFRQDQTAPVRLLLPTFWFTLAAPSFYASCTAEARTQDPWIKKNQSLPKGPG